MFELPQQWAQRARELFQQRGTTIRLMRPDDLDEVLRIIRLHDSDDYKAARASFPRDRFHLPLEQTAHFVIEDAEERRVVGVSGYYIDDLESHGIYWLGWTYVNPFKQGHGYGGQLMRFIVSAVEELGARKLYLSTSSLPEYAKAVGFYNRYGFVQEGCLKDYYNPGEDKLILAKPLTPATRAVHIPPQQQPPTSSYRDRSTSSYDRPPERDRDRDRDHDRRRKPPEDDNVTFEF